MRIGPYIMVAVCAVSFGSGPAGAVWLCVRADGSVGMKMNVEALCGSAPFVESDDHDENVPVAALEDDDCCLDISVSLGGGPHPAKVVRQRKVDLSPTPTQMPALCTLSVPTATEFGLLIQSPPPGLSHLSVPIRTDVLLI